MNVYIVKEYSDPFHEGRMNIAGVYASYLDAEEHAEEIAEYGGFEQEGDCWYLDDMEMLSIETHEVL
jgi:hypothetical protein